MTFKQIDMWQFRETALDFIKEHMMVYLGFAFVNKQASSPNTYKHVMELKFLMELNNSLDTLRYTVLQGIWSA